MSIRTLLVSNAIRRSANDLHDYLVSKGVSPLAVFNNAVYQDGTKISEATEFRVFIDEMEAEICAQLIHDFMMSPVTDTTQFTQSAADVM